MHNNIELSRDVTRLLVEWRRGDAGALEELTTILYSELRRLAASYFRKERSDHTLQPTALVHEAYVRMARLSQFEWRDRAHFLGITAHLMRQILVQHARTKHAEKRGGMGNRVELETGSAVAQPQQLDVIALEDALQQLSARDALKAQILELKYFGGMTTEEIAEVLETSVATVGRQQRVALAWLYRHLHPQ